ncbi:MAG TPA: hypothetical protein VM911_06755 [Pyrinomonadaceae bacterium]|jgi:ppGpp synthetase/RelA/SpoT-type nucleotidyltranferase|nr:hypothetical protein [Pyrinomonadaceae bacterium]
MNVEALRREFRAREHIYKHLEGEALFILNKAIEHSAIKIHSVSSRIKNLDAFLDKAQRKQLENPLGEIQDIVGLRVVCLFLSDINRIVNIIRDSFFILNEDNKIEDTNVSSFGYMSVHFIVTIKKEHSGPRYDPIANVSFEIQVRTIAMDAWANVSHHLDYKSDNDVPSDLRKDFYALSGLFYVADKHFEMFYRVSKQSKKEMEELFEVASPEIKALQEINLDSLTAYLRAKLPDRKHSDPKSVSTLVDELLRAGYTSIGEIDRLVDSAQEALEHYEKDHPPSIGIRKFADVGAVRISVKLADDSYHRLSVSRTFQESDLDLEETIRRNNAKYEKYRSLLKK